MRLLSLLPAAVAALLSAGCLAPTYLPPTMAAAPPGAHVTADVAAGYDAYHDGLAAYGEWAPDNRYGAHWCPTLPAGEIFRPYQTRGQWVASPRAYGYAPAGSPTWESEDADTWGEITTHHGAWVMADAAAGPSWCWVPGAAETPGAVVWRVGGGFVGWAPEPPELVIYDDVDYDALEWSYTFTGSLYEGDLGSQLLTDDARTVASDATAPAAPVRGQPPELRRVGPARPAVVEAKNQLALFSATHQEAIAQAVVAAGGKKPGGAAGAGASAGGASGGGKKEGSSSSGASASASTGTSAKKQAPKDALPPAMSFYAVMIDDPMLDAELAGPPGAGRLVGPAGIAPSPLAGARASNASDGTSAHGSPMEWVRSQRAQGNAGALLARGAGGAGTRTPGATAVAHGYGGSLLGSASHSSGGSVSGGGSSHGGSSHGGSSYGGSSHGSYRGSSGSSSSSHGSSSHGSSSHGSSSHGSSHGHR